LSRTYVAGGSSPLEAGLAHAAYLAIRLPATYAAVRATLGMIPGGLRDGVRSALDLGAGPGTATWALRDACHLDSVLQVDRSAAMLSLAARLAERVTDAAAPTVTGRTADLGRGGPWPAADIAVAAYSLAELDGAGRRALVSAAWAAAPIVVLVEPGTPDGFGRIHDARRLLLDAGAALVAPCPHGDVCPMHATPGEWCHFAVRVPRTRRHRQLKGGTLGYEDEKFACLVVTRLPVSEPGGSRILRHPRIDKGRIGMLVCAPTTAQPIVVTRHDPRFRAARKTSWGDRWPPHDDADAS